MEDMEGGGRGGYGWKGNPAIAFCHSRGAFCGVPLHFLCFCVLLFTFSIRSVFPSRAEVGSWKLRVSTYPSGGTVSDRISTCAICRSFNLKSNSDTLTQTLRLSLKTNGLLFVVSEKSGIQTNRSQKTWNQTFGHKDHRAGADAERVTSQLVGGGVEQIREMEAYAQIQDVTQRKRRAQFPSSHDRLMSEFGGGGCPGVVRGWGGGLGGRLRVSRIPHNDHDWWRRR